MKHNDVAKYIVGYISVTALAVVIVLGIVSIFSPKFRKLLLKPTCISLGIVVASYLVLRGIAEFWTVDYSNSASYRFSWGGPSLIGVFAVHSGPGLMVLIAFSIWLYRRIKRNKRDRK